MGGRRLCSKFEINMWQKHFQSTMDHKTWDGFETTSINWIWKQWVIEYWNWTMVTCRGRKELFWYLEKLRFLLSKKLWKNQNPLMGLQELFAKLFLYFEKISTFWLSKDLRKNQNVLMSIAVALLNFGAIWKMPFKNTD